MQFLVLNNNRCNISNNYNKYTIVVSVIGIVFIWVIISITFFGKRLNNIRIELLLYHDNRNLLLSVVSSNNNNNNNNHWYNNTTTTNSTTTNGLSKNTGKTITSSNHYSYNNDRDSSTSNAITILHGYDIINKTLRHFRFPSREERVQIYMSEWYNSNNNNNIPTCCPDYNEQILLQYSYNSDTKAYRITTIGDVTVSDDVDHQNKKTITIPSNQILTDVTFALDIETIINCSASKNLTNKQQRHRHYGYCDDVIDTIIPAIKYNNNNNDNIGSSNNNIPILLQFGDSNTSSVAYMNNISIPIIAKFRNAIIANHQTERRQQQQQRSKQNCTTTCPKLPITTPILWKLQTQRHFDPLYKVVKKDKLSWSKKISKAVFRGTMTGYNHRYNKERNNKNNNNNNTNHNVELCMNIPRCRLVYQYSNSTVIDAKLTNTFNILPTHINNVQLVSTRKTMDELLQYKILIFLEGNDVSSGLKWGLYSRSIVIMPEPTYTTWVMEEQLQPYIHYVPIYDNLTNIEEQIQWILNNEQHAIEISLRATMWIYDLVFHNDAQMDDIYIQNEIIRRYYQYWTKTTT